MTRGGDAVAFPAAYAGLHRRSLIKTFRKETA
jgi:hypothetical protein